MSDDRIERAQKMVDLAPDNELARFSLGKALFDAERYADALPHFQVAIDKRSDWMAVHILIGKCHLCLGNKIAARAALEQARQLALQQKHASPLAETEQLLEDLDAS
ncbi:MAG: molecular chaperone DnaJ [Verrucomicrobiota bacterium]